MKFEGVIIVGLLVVLFLFGVALGKRTWKPPVESVTTVRMDDFERHLIGLQLTSMRHSDQFHNLYYRLDELSKRVDALSTDDLPVAP